jgi:hypothetical protein
MVARPAGGTEPEPEPVNVPSDGSPRVVANSLAFFSSADTEKLTDVAVRPSSTATTPTTSYPACSARSRVWA